MTKRDLQDCQGLGTSGRSRISVATTLETLALTVFILDGRSPDFVFHSLLQARLQRTERARYAKGVLCSAAHAPRQLGLPRLRSLSTSLECKKTGHRGLQPQATGN